MIQELQTLGLSYYESKALEILLKEKLSLENLSKKSGIPFGKVYSIVKSLKQKGLIKETNSRPKLIYTENASNLISKLIKEKQEKENVVISKLRNLVTNIDKKKGEITNFFQIGTTINDNKQIQLRAFNGAEKEVLQILNIHHKPGTNRESKLIWEKEIKKAILRGIIFKSIYPKKIVLPKIIANLNKKYPKKFQIRKIDTDFIRCDIIDRKKVLLKLVCEDALLFGGILLIEDEKLAENLIKVFNNLWEQAD
ncbi:MAG: helix-turn-helix domain-containing protein [Candidatus Nanoarchaeia archaeon]|nr:helix-turn-helix domain-containing protein [Candidatus Nanoarchaeia archaeon]MDD5587524.1 helix-turn-helix domain-containing protein [Candidatus Nanoarchaeia archaeon]